MNHNAKQISLFSLLFITITMVTQSISAWGPTIFQTSSQAYENLYTGNNDKNNTWEGFKAHLESGLAKVKKVVTFGAENAADNARMNTFKAEVEGSKVAIINAIQQRKTAFNYSIANDATSKSIQGTVNKFYDAIIAHITEIQEDVEKYYRGATDAEVTPASKG